MFERLRSQFDLPFKFWIIALIAFINSVSFTILIPIVYPYAKQFGFSDFQASLLMMDVRSHILLLDLRDEIQHTVVTDTIAANN